jgi:hypothetical protein
LLIGIDLTKNSPLMSSGYCPYLMQDKLPMVQSVFSAICNRESSFEIEHEGAFEQLNASKLGF